MSMSARFVPSIAPRRRRARRSGSASAAWTCSCSTAATTTSCRPPPRPTALGIAPVRSLYLGELDGVPCRSAELPDDHEAPAGHGVPHAARPLRPHRRAPLDAGRPRRAARRVGSHAPPLRPLRRAHRARAGRARAALPRVRPRGVPAPLAGRDRARHARRRDPAGARAALPRAASTACSRASSSPASRSRSASRASSRRRSASRSTDIAYFASQPWPFPHSLMIGFTATWVSGDLRIEEAELVDARWFTRDDLPELPGRLSIARKLIDDWLYRALGQLDRRRSRRRG